MSKQKKISILITTVLVSLLLSCKVQAESILNGEIELSQNYLEYLELSDKKNLLVPRMYDISKSEITITNPFRLTRLLGSSVGDDYSLRDYIPENMVVKNQESTNTCWTFSSLASLESNLALQNYKNKIATPIVYDFSERHMDYATSNTFLNDAVNKFGFNRRAGNGGVYGMSIAYLTNGLGAIDESEMEFENNSNIIDISEIQNKNVITQVNDITIFPSYSATEDKTQIIQKMKEHIKNYGAISASIHGASFLTGSSVYNSATAAAFCNSDSYKIDHAVAIVGWDDDFPVENFVAGNRPQNKGAWIIRNSWGTGFGDEGYMYMSYEDVNIYQELTGITNAQTDINYENIYQYDDFGGFLKYKANGMSKIYLANEFDKKTSGKEYLTQVSINAAEPYTCKVYVNPNGTSKKQEDLQLVKLKTGDSETFEAGYHTIEFLNPIKINSSSYVVVVEIQGTQENTVSAMVEINFGEFFTDSKYANAANHVYDNVTIANNKCFIAQEKGFKNNQWTVTSNLYESTEGKLPNFDTTIKAFSTSKVLENIEITTLPRKTSYIEGQAFDKTGMIVKGNYANGDVVDITDYIIQDGTKLIKGQESITISYKNFTVKQPIEVVANTVEKLEITTPPTKTEYWAGDDFEIEGMTFKAIYKDETVKTEIEPIIKDGQNLKNGQTEVTFEFEGKIVKQSIIVNANPVEEIEIVQKPKKLNYVSGQSFDKTGLIVKATYKSGKTKEVTDYTIKDGKGLQIGQTSVTIEFEDKTISQSITVVEKTVTGITVKTAPNKIEYIQDKEQLDLTGGVIEISYNDNTVEQMTMTSEDISVSGFNNEKVGMQIITITYENKTTQFEVQIKELPKPVNSDFNGIKGNVKRIRAFYYTDVNKEEYSIINVECSNFVKASGNESIEYYYCLSSNPNEENLTKWIKIDKIQEDNNTLSFEINTLDIDNNEELINANDTYLYIKEVATRNGMKAEAVTSSLLLSIGDVKIEKYVDGEKIDEETSDIVVSEPANKGDNTTAEGTIPKAGRNILRIFFILLIFVIGRIAYLRYKDIKIH